MVGNPQMGDMIEEDNFSLKHNGLILIICLIATLLIIISINFMIRGLFGLILEEDGNQVSFLHIISIFTMIIGCALFFGAYPLLHYLYHKKNG